MSSARRFFVGGNWKCNGTRESNSKLISELNQSSIPSKDVIEVVICPVALHLESVSKAVRPEIVVGAQNCWVESKGAFTGEISPSQIKDLGIDWVILGHSERRDIFQENDDLISRKTSLALKTGLSVIACVGEHKEEREAMKTEEVVFRQLKAIAANVAADQWKSVVIAYEPVWAIGTGLTATPDMAQEVHIAIRKWLKENVSAEVANATRVIYGGSVKGANALDLAKMPDIDGFLVGGASLIGAEFLTIINSVSAKQKTWSPLSHL